MRVFQGLGFRGLGSFCVFRLPSKKVRKPLVLRMPFGLFEQSRGPLWKDLGLYWESFRLDRVSEEVADEMPARRSGFKFDEGPRL